MMVFMALISRVRVDSLAEDTDEVSKEPLVHVSWHLIENQPVTKRAVLDIMFYMAVIFVLLEVSSDFPFDQVISNKSTLELNIRTNSIRPDFPEWNGKNPINKPQCPNDEKYEVPKPNNKKYLIIDHIKAKDAECILLLLASSRAISRNYL